jgi:protein-S-isoprenylcysteine O-methyltransferase Ste14
MNLVRLLRLMIILFPLSEICLLLFKRRRSSANFDADKGSLRILWITILASLGVTIALQWYPLTPLPLSRSTIQWISLILLIVGFILRWTSVLTLGRWFTAQVAIQPHQVLVQNGLYKYLRHPSYTGLLLEFLGLGVFFGSWASLLIIMIPTTLAVLNRIRKEEAALLTTFGEAYRQYQQRTRRLFWGIY